MEFVCSTSQGAFTSYTIWAPWIANGPASPPVDLAKSHITKAGIVYSIYTVSVHHISLSLSLYIYIYIHTHLLRMVIANSEVEMYRACKKQLSHLKGLDRVFEGKPHTRSECWLRWSCDSP